MGALNPRVLREQFASFAGKKVMIGLRNYHYVCCRVVDVAGKNLNVTVDGKAMQIPTDGIETIHETYEAEREFVK